MSDRNEEIKVPNENDQPTIDDLPEDANIAQVREALKRENARRKAAEASVATAESLRRENAFLRAGVDAESPIGQLFTKGYDGELDVDAIKSAWTAINPSAPQSAPVAPQDAGQPAPQPAPDGGLTEEQLERLRQSQGALNSQGVPPGAEPQGPLGQAVMDAAFDAQGGARARPTQGMSDKSLNAGFSVLFERANQDDPSAVFKRPTETWGDAAERWRRENG